MELITRTGTMYPPVIGQMKTECIESIVNAVLGHGFQPLQITIVHKFLDVFWFLEPVGFPWIITLTSWAVAGAAELCHVSSSHFILCAGLVRFVVVNLEVGDVNDGPAVLVLSFFMDEVPHETCALHINKALQGNRKHRVEILRFDHILICLFIRVRFWIFLVRAIFF